MEEADSGEVRLDDLIFPGMHWDKWLGFDRLIYLTHYSNAGPLRRGLGVVSYNTMDPSERCKFYALLRAEDWGDEPIAFEELLNSFSTSEGRRVDSVKASFSNRRRQLTVNAKQMTWRPGIATVFDISSKKLDTIYVNRREGNVSPEVFRYDSQDSITVIIDTAAQEDFEWRYYRIQDFRPLSLVGSYFSYEESYEGDGGAHPAYGSVWQTVNIERMHSSDLRELFNEQDIFEQLMKDSIIISHLEVNDPASLNDLLNNLQGGCEMDLRGLMNSFRIVDVELGKAEVEFGLTHGCEVDRGKFTSFSIILPIPEEKKEMFLDAKNRFTLGRDFSDW